LVRAWLEGQAPTFLHWRWRAGAYHLNFSIPAPLNPIRKPLSWLAQDLEAEPLAGAVQTASIARKANHVRSLGAVLAIISVTEQ
jgi:hypothetical protein